MSTPAAPPHPPSPNSRKRLPHRLVNNAWRLARRLGMGKISLDENGLIDQARRETGLYHFGYESFIEPLRHVLYGLQFESHTNPMGDFFARQNIVRLLKNRLIAEELFTRHPQILERELAPPLAVVGLARSGTTRTHRLLACDSRFVHLKTWEGILPAPIPASFTATVDPRRTQINFAMKVVAYLMPEMAAIHPLGTYEVEEEAALIQHGFETSLFAAMNTLPSYFNWYIDRPCDASYDYMVKLLKLISWFRGDNPQQSWILKTPEHMINFRPLLRCFPDAKIISTHRDPLAVLSSLMSMAWTALSRDYDELSTEMIASQWKRFLDTSLRNYLDVRDSSILKPGQIIDLRYEDINRDWRSAVENAYSHFDLELSGSALAAMSEWMEQNKQGKHGKHQHTLEQFGLERKALLKEYRYYYERFNIALPEM